VRPGFIVGPDDPSGRFTYYPVRADRGGDMLAPGAPTDPIQFIDVRDLGAWLIRLVEDGTTGVFNATGPASRMTWGSFVDTCSAVAASKPKVTWVAPEFIEKQKLHFPLWVPYSGDTRGFHTRSIARALAAGLRFRPARETAADTLAWYKSPAAQGRTRLAGPTSEQESAAVAVLKKAETAPAA
jgi:2'-hydroxyisoflavone reductase